MKKNQSRESLADDLDVSNSTRPEQEMHVHKSAQYKCHRRTRIGVPCLCVMESIMQHAGNPREGATDPVNLQGTRD